MKDQCTSPLLRHFAPVLNRYIDAIARDRDENAARRLRSRVTNEAEAIVSEALVWQLLLDSRLHPVCEPLLEDGRRPDFRARSSSVGDLHIEVGVIQSEPMHQRTSFDPLKECAFDYDEHKISQVVKDKSVQLLDAQTPAVVFLATHSLGGGVMFGEVPASQMLTGRQVLKMPLHVNGDGELWPGDIQLATDFDHSLFLNRSQTGAVEAIRRSISAVVLIDFDSCRARLRALLHPDPLFPISPRFFQSMPLGHVAPWPIKDRVRVVWSQSDNGIWDYPEGTVALSD